MLISQPAGEGSLSFLGTMLIKIKKQRKKEKKKNGDSFIILVIYPLCMHLCIGGIKQFYEFYEIFPPQV